MGEMMDDPAAHSQDVGLCANCTHVEVVVSSRGSRFCLCRLSATDPRFARYPRLPVLTCPGYRPKTEPPRSA
jgi:hypothetical protein